MSDSGPVHDFVTAIQNGDNERAMARLSPDIRISEPEGLLYGGEYVGIDACLRLFGMIFENYRPEILSFRTVDAGDVTILLANARWTSTHTERSTDMKFCEIYATEDGLITSIEFFPRTAERCTSWHWTRSS
jgi:hypothetical protein